MLPGARHTPRPVTVSSLEPGNCTRKRRRSAHDIDVRTRLPETGSRSLAGPRSSSNVNILGALRGIGKNGDVIVANLEISTGKRQKHLIRSTPETQLPRGKQG